MNETLDNAINDWWKSYSYMYQSKVYHYKSHIIIMQAIYQMYYCMFLHIYIKSQYSWQFSEGLFLIETGLIRVMKIELPGLSLLKAKLTRNPIIIIGNSCLSQVLYNRIWGRERVGWQIMPQISWDFPGILSLYVYLF